MRAPRVSVLVRCAHRTINEPPGSYSTKHATKPLSTSILHMYVHNECYVFVVNLWKLSNFLSQILQRDNLPKKRQSQQTMEKVTKMRDLSLINRATFLR